MVSFNQEAVLKPKKNQNYNFCNSNSNIKFKDLANRKRTLRRRDFYTPESKMFGHRNQRPAIVKLKNNAFRKGNCSTQLLSRSKYGVEQLARNGNTAVYTVQC